MAQISVATVNEASASLANIRDTIKTDFTAPCVGAAAECGIAGQYKQAVEDASAALKVKLDKVVDQYGVISGNLDTFGKDIEGFLSAGRFDTAVDAISSSQTEEVDARGSKF